MKKAIKYILIGAISLVVLFAVGISVFTGRQVFKGVTNTVSREETVTNSEQFAEKYGDFKSRYFVEKVMIDNPNGPAPIPAIYVSQEGNRNVAILVHGMGGTKETLTDVMDSFLDLGYDVIAYDQRNSGENMTDFNTVGVLESLDALTVVDFVKSIYDDSVLEPKVALWGESYGALTSIIAAGRDDTKIDYLIVDSPISDGRVMINNEMIEVEKNEGIPVNFLTATGDWYTKAALGISFSDMDGVKWMANVNVPVLITNSSDDTLTPPYMAENLYEAISHDKKEIVTVDGFGHGQFPLKDKVAYEEILRNFFGKYK